MMKNYLPVLIISFFTFFSLRSFSQSPVVEWKFSAGKRSGNEYIVSAKAVIQKDWKLFSTSMKDDEPNSRINLDSSSSAAVLEIKESNNLKKAREPLFDNAEIRYFENQAEFTLHISADKAGKEIKGRVNYMAIKGSEVVGPEEVPFRFSFDPSGNLVA